MELDIDKYFHYLGMHKETNYLFVKSKKRVFKFEGSPSSLKLLGIAPKRAWLYSFRKGQNPNGTTVDWEEASSYLVERTEEKQFNPENIKGSGVFMVDGEVIISGRNGIFGIKGDKRDNLIGDTVFSPDSDFHPPIPGEVTKEEEALIKKGFKVILRRTWADDRMGALYCSFIVSGMIGGVLPFRPAIWISGPINSGKTSMVKLLDEITKHFSIRTLTLGTTEAGFRRITANSSAICKFDEFETDDAKDLKVIKKILQLVRGVITSGGGSIVQAKTGKSREAEVYKSQCSFCFSSIRIFADSPADTDRIIFLDLKKRKDKEGKDNEYCKYKRDLSSVDWEKFGKAVYKKALRKWEVILIDYEDIMAEEHEYEAYNVEVKKVNGHKKKAYALCASVLKNIYGQFLDSSLFTGDRLLYSLGNLVDRSQNECTKLLLDSRPFNTAKENRTIRQIAVDAEGKDAHGKESLGLLKQLNLSLVRTESHGLLLFVSNDSVHLKNRIFKGSRWEGGSWKNELMGVKKGQAHIHGIRESGTFIRYRTEE